MPARNTQFRALKEEFCSFLDRQEAWPKYSALLRALKSKRGGRRADIVEMKKGSPVPQKYVICLTQLIHDKPILKEFLARQGVLASDMLTMDQIIDLIAEPLQPYAAPEEGAIDWQLRGLNGLAEVFTDFVWRKLIHPETLCHDEDDVRTAITMIMATGGRQLHGGKSHLSDADAIRLAEKHMHITYNDYFRRGLDLWRAARWTFTFGVIGRQRVACACVLPLKDSAYEEMRRGERNSHTCSGDDLVVPSRSFFIEAVGQKSDAEYPFFSNKTIQVLRIIHLQLACMSLKNDTGPAHSESPIRILSIAGDRLNEKRLKSFGYRHTGTRMPGFNIQFMEMDMKRSWFITAVIAKLKERLLSSNEEF